MVKLRDVVPVHLEEPWLLKTIGIHNLTLFGHIYFGLEKLFSSLMDGI